MPENKSIARQITQLSKKEIFFAIKHAKTIVKESGITIKVAPIVSDSIGKVLIVIPKKYGNAPKRNKLRRRIKHIFYEQTLYQKPYIWIVRAFPEAALLNFQDLEMIIKKGAQVLEGS